MHLSNFDDAVRKMLYINLAMLIIIIMSVITWRVGFHDPQKEKEELKKGIHTTAMIVDKEELTRTELSNDGYMDMGIAANGQAVMMMPNGGRTQTKTDYVLHLHVNGETYTKSVDSKTYNRFNVKDDVNVIVYGDNKIKIEY